WHSLVRLLQGMLGYEIKFDNDFQLTVDSKLVDQAYQQFSDGQKKLFAFGVTLAGDGASGQEQIAIFDEPETSLHPRAAIEMIRLIQNALADGQLWIAT